MSISVSITMHSPQETPEQTEAWENEQLRLVRALLPQLDGVQTATASTVGRGYVDLTDAQ